MRIRFLLFAALVVTCASLIAPHARAQNANAVGYTASMPVSDTSDAQRNHAFAVVLGRILTRTDGLQITGAPGFTDALGSAANLVQNYQYMRAPLGASQPFVLKMQFDPAAVQSLSRNLQKQLTAAEPAPDTSAATTEAATVWVSPLRSALDLARLLSTVRADAGVTSVEPVGAQADGVLLRIQAQGGLPALLGSLQAGGHLQADGGQHPGADASLRWSR